MRKINVTLFFLLIFTSAAFAQNILSTANFHAQEAKYKSELLNKIRAANLEETENQKAYDVTYYDLNFDLDPDAKVLAGKVTMHAKVVEAQINIVQLNFLDNMVVDSVFSAGEVTTYQHDGGILSIQLNREYLQNESFIVTVKYHGQPQASGFGAFAFDTHNGKPMIWTLSEPYGARNWWPCKDIPADKADSVDIHATVPSNLVVASNGNLREVAENNGEKTFWWHESYPIVTYLVSLAIYPYKQFSDWYVYGDNDSMEVKFFVFPDHYNDLKENYFKTAKIIKFYSDTFGQYPFIKEKYGHAEFNWGGGMEHQTITSLGGWGESLIAHELAHQWWGDMITCESFHHIWLNEGFATYCEALWAEHTRGPQALHTNMAHNRYLGPGTIYVEDTNNDDIFSGALSYAKASWVLHMLRHIVGDTTFFNILREYYQRYQYETATTEQFRDVCEEISGLDLHTYFYQWIYESGHPEYEYLWKAEKMAEGQYKVSGMINQTQKDGPVFKMPVDITIKTQVHDTTIVFMDTTASAPFEFTVNSKPTGVVLDKDEWILRRVQEINSPKFQVLSIAVHDSLGNNNAEFERGEQISLVIDLANFGVDAANVQAKLSTDDADISILQGDAQYGNLATGDDSTNFVAPFVLRAAENASSHIAKLVLEVKAGNDFQDKLELFLNLGQANILLVDDDAGANHQKYIEALAINAGLLTKTWDVASSGLMTLADLLKYDAVVWFTGDDSTSSLTADEQKLVGDYLNAGGKLLLSGRNIADDLVGNGTPADSAFYTHVLHAQFSGEKTDEYMIMGARDDLFFRSAVVYFRGNFGGANNQKSLPVLEPIEPATIAFQYLPDLKVAGVRYEDQASGARLIYAGFGLEGIAGPVATSGGTLLQKSISWLLGTTKVAAGENTSPLDFALMQNYPNPFNPNTHIAFSLPQSAKVEASVYNTLGQRVLILYQGKLDAGTHRFEWNGQNSGEQNVSSGVYLLRINVKYSDTAEANKTVKMVKLQ